ncbi:amino acid ABC transporter permease [Vaginisenegalia massiliensis]|uniref:amino acid ABC transporter permease n=1 Tax=Vaginisenegalia massiliensis TaxID=2058294 RepID=UPI000F524778|nr:amino acid ABC transporter permease [Vaginisenegalia massiliensis]
MSALLNQYGPQLVEGFLHTLLASCIALIGSCLLGGLMGVLQVSPSGLTRRLATCYVEFFRNIPLLVIVMFFYIVIPMYVFPIDGFAAGVIGLTLYTSSFIADNVRAGIQSISVGQHEAGLSQGFTRQQTMRYIILPQAVRIIIPALGNQFINLVKNSSTLAMVAGLDLMYYGDLISQETFNTFETYILIGLFYLCITVPLTFLMKHLERRLALS